MLHLCLSQRPTCRRSKHAAIQQPDAAVSRFTWWKCLRLSAEGVARGNSATLKQLMGTKAEKMYRQKEFFFSSPAGAEVYVKRQAGPLSSC